MTAPLDSLRRIRPARWLAASAGLGAAALALMVAGAAWPAIMLLAGGQAALLAAGIVAHLGDSARREGSRRAGGHRALPRS